MLWKLKSLIIIIFFSVPIGLYGFQHYISILGSLILIPLVIVPAMGGTYVSFLQFLCLLNLISYITVFCFIKNKKPCCGYLGLIGFSGCRRILQMWYQRFSLCPE